MRTRIESDGHRVTLTYTDRWDGEITRTFVAPSCGGYVREIWPGRNSDAQQVCEGLYSSGDTLESSTDTLLAVIRREWRRRRAAERRECV